MNWVSCFKISFYDNNVNQMSLLTRDQMQKFDKSNFHQRIVVLENNCKGVLLTLKHFRTVVFCTLWYYKNILWSFSKICLLSTKSRRQAYKLLKIKFFQKCLWLIFALRATTVENWKFQNIVILLMVKIKLPPRSDSSLEAVEPHP